MKENKTKASQIKAVNEYQKRKGIVTLGCKVTMAQKEEITKHYKKNGYKSMNEYLLSLIYRDIKNQ